MTLLDTSVIIAFLRGDEKIVALIKEASLKNNLKTTTITEYELLKYKDEIGKNAAEKFLSHTTIIPFDRAAAQKAAVLFQELQDAGQMINENDLLIAGVALTQNEVLLTRDKKLAKLHKHNIKIV